MVSRRQSRRALPYVNSTTTIYTLIRRSCPLRPLPLLTSTERNNNNNNDNSNSIDLDDGNHEHHDSNFPLLVNHEWNTMMNRLAYAYNTHKCSDKEYNPGSGSDPRGTRPKPDPRDIDIPVQEDCSCGNTKSRPILPC